MAAKKGKAGELYILGNQNVTMEEFIKMVCEEAKINHWIIPKIPVLPLKIGTYALKMLSDNLTHTPPLSTPAEIAYTSQYLFFDNSKAKRELGLSLTPINESIANSISWFKRKGFKNDKI
ncbi:MAG: hypothetical protein HQK79_12485 [Desulfobacterales bacterium]|nr:hypothetical protein [Desulfobacterales bacterium]